MHRHAWNRGSASNRIGQDQESGHAGQLRILNTYRSRRVCPSTVVFAIFLIIASDSLCCVLHPLCLEAQGTDAVVTERNRKRFTVGDELSEGPEREAFIALYQKMSPRKRAQLADTFLSNYPASRVLAQVYEIAAKAQIQLGNYDRVLKYANKSLQIYPENMSLLVPLANVEAQMGLNEKAEQTARHALEYLQRFNGPSVIPKRKWQRLRPQLMASCYYVMARVRVVRGLNPAHGPERTELLKQSLTLLAKASELNPKDSEIHYLMGLSQLALGREDAAAANFARAARSQDPAIRPKALEKLTGLYQASGLGQKMSFRSYIHKLSSQPEPNPPRHHASQAKGKTQLPGYAGSQACRLCHSDIYDNWSHTGMAKMLRPYEPQNVIGDFHNSAFYIGDEVKLKRNGQLEIIPGKTKEAVFPDGHSSRTSVFQDPGIRRTLAFLSRGLHDWFKMGAGLCDSTTKRRDPRFSDSVQCNS
jgi:tetratricopeptide (TPR) repeat protein